MVDIELGELDGSLGCESVGLSGAALEDPTKILPDRRSFEWQ